ncbi:MAG TPA: hypothetical protein O0Y08_04085 [Methanocorpusculum sp.]|nr:hypothetical protein [Methanocorpusculum sp.]
MHPVINENTYNEDTYNKNQMKVISYLKKEIAAGRNFFKAKHISSDLGITAKEAGTTLGILSKKCSELDIVPWSYSGTSTTWKVSFSSAAAPCACDE